MSQQLDMYEVRVLPYNYCGEHGGIERVYQIRVSVNGETLTNQLAIDRIIPPYLSEIEFLNRLTQDIISKLRSKYEQDGSVSKDTTHRR